MNNSNSFTRFLEALWAKYWTAKTTWACSHPKK